MTDRRPLTPLSEAERTARLAELGLGPDLLKINLTHAERTAAMDPGLPPASPTGTPLIPATGLVLKVAGLIVALAGVVLVSDFWPGTGLDEKIAGAVVALGTVLGIASPGVRKP